MISTGGTRSMWAIKWLLGCCSWLMAGWSEIEGLRLRQFVTSDLLTWNIDLNRKNEILAASCFCNVAQIKSGSPLLFEESLWYSSSFNSNTFFVVVFILLNFDWQSVWFFFGTYELITMLRLLFVCLLF